MFSLKIAFNKKRFSGGSQAGSSGGSGSVGMKSIPFHRPVLQQNSIDMLVSIIKDTET